jgi:hypothetical protein
LLDLKSMEPERSQEPLVLLALEQLVQLQLAPVQPEQVLVLLHFQHQVVQVVHQLVQPHLRRQ